MTSKQKDNLSLEQAYRAICESAEKCPECGCNPSSPKEGCECEHHNEEAKDETVAEAKAKGQKPDYLDVDGDGDTKEPMKKALKDKEKKGSSNKGPSKKESKKVDESLEQVYEQLINESRK